MLRGESGVGMRLVVLYYVLRCESGVGMRSKYYTFHGPISGVVLLPLELLTG